MEDKGVVIVRNILTLEEQLRLIDIVQRKGNLKDADNMWNFFGIRGRHFCNITKYTKEDTEFLIFCTQKFKNIVEKLDISLVWPPVTHMLTMWYPDTKGMGWHRDGYGGNDGDEGAPVYSLTLGNSCIFEYKLEGENKVKREVELYSGDIIVFGSCQRLMMHRVKSVKKGSFLQKKDFDARINLTFRTCTDFNSDNEAEYQTEAYTQKLKEKWNKKIDNNI